MEPNSGGRHVCKITLYAVIILELFWLLVETRGDFANGILFYLQAQLNIYVWGFFALLFLSSYFLGRRMGVDLVKGRNQFEVAIIYGLFVSVILVAYGLIIFATHGQWRNMFHTIPELSFIIIIPTLLLWLIAASSLRQKMR